MHSSAAPVQLPSARLSAGSSRTTTHPSLRQSTCPPPPRLSPPLRTHRPTPLSRLCFPCSRRRTWSSSRRTERTLPCARFTCGLHRRSIVAGRSSSSQRRPRSSKSSFATLIETGSSRTAARQPQHGVRSSYFPSCSTSMTARCSQGSSSSISFRSTSAAPRRGSNIHAIKVFALACIHGLEDQAKDAIRCLGLWGDLQPTAQALSHAFTTEPGRIQSGWRPWSVGDIPTYLIGRMPAAAIQKFCQLHSKVLTTPGYSWAKAADFKVRHSSWPGEVV